MVGEGVQFPANVRERLKLIYLLDSTLVWIFLLPMPIVVTREKEAIFDDELGPIVDPLQTNRHTT